MQNKTQRKNTRMNEMKWKCNNFKTSAFETNLEQA